MGDQPTPATICGFFDAVRCDNRDDAERILGELGGLGGIFDRRAELAPGDLDHFFNVCEMRTFRKDHEYVKRLFDCPAIEPRDDRFLDWVLRDEFDCTPSVHLLVAIGRLDKLQKLKKMTCPSEFLCENDAVEIQSARMLAAFSHQEFPTIERCTDTGVNNSAAEYSFQRLEELDDEGKLQDQQAKEFVQLMQRICARNSADIYMKVPLTSRAEFNRQIVAALRAKHSHCKVFHGMGGCETLTRGFPSTEIYTDDDYPSNIVFYILREAPSVDSISLAANYMKFANLPMP